nr:hypothetical protein [uncultured Roseovarius sp.]
MSEDSKTQTSAKNTTKSRKPLWMYLKQCAAHLWLGIRDLWPVWCGITALGIFCFFDFEEQVIRLTGMALQLIGVATVAKKLRDSGRLFQKPTVRERIALYFKRFPRRRVTTHNLTPQGISSESSASSPRLFSSPGPDTPLEQRVEMLEEKTSGLFEDVSELGGKLRAQSNDLTRKITKEATQRKEEHKSIEEQLERAVVGGIHVEWSGVIFFIAGIILASASPEIACMLGNSGN